MENDLGVNFQNIQYILTTGCDIFFVSGFTI
jgi:hypothetical protein